MNTPYVSYYPYEIEYDFQGFIYLVTFSVQGNILSIEKHTQDLELVIGFVITEDELVQAQDEVDRVLQVWNEERREAKASGGYNEDYS